MESRIRVVAQVEPYFCSHEIITGFHYGGGYYASTSARVLLNCYSQHGRALMLASQPYTYGDVGEFSQIRRCHGEFASRVWSEAVDKSVEDIGGHISYRLSDDEFPQFVPKASWLCGELTPEDVESVFIFNQSLGWVYTDLRGVPVSDRKDKLVFLPAMSIVNGEVTNPGKIAKSLSGHFRQYLL